MKPDFLDLDKDGNKKEPMKKAAREAKKNGKKPTNRKREQSKAEAKKQDGGIPFDSLKEGALKRMLKVKDGEKKLGKMEMNRLAKVEDGEEFEFRGNRLKMTKLMKKRVNLAKTMMKF
jgi:hypothetical protein